MAFRIEVKEEAKQDIALAMEWYESKALHLDKRFLKAVEETLRAIQKNPFSFKKVYRNFRQAAVKKFPYVVVYEPVQTVVVIYSIFNTWQNPKKKMRRIKK